MAKKTNTVAIAIGAVALVTVVYLITRNKNNTTYPGGGSTYIPDSSVQKTQLLAWAGEQSNSLSLQNLIKNMSGADLLNIWNAVFGTDIAENADIGDILDYYNIPYDNWLWS